MLILLLVIRDKPLNVMQNYLLLSVSQPNNIIMCHMNMFRAQNNVFYSFCGNMGNKRRVLFFFCELYMKYENGNFLTTMAFYH